MDTRDKILETFYKLLAEKGYTGASMNDVVKRAGISKGAIYHYFKNKEELLFSVFHFVFAKDAILVFNLDNVEKGKYKEKLIEVGEKYLLLNKVDEHYTKFRNEFVVLSLREPKVRDYLVKSFYEYMEMFREFLVKLQEKGVISEDIDVELKATQLFMTLDSMILYQSFELELEYAQLWRDVVESIFD